METPDTKISVDITGNAHHNEACFDASSLAYNVVSCAIYYHPSDISIHRVYNLLIHSVKRSETPIW